MQYSATVEAARGEETENGQEENGGEIDELVNEFERSRVANALSREKTFWKIGEFITLV